MPRDGPLIPAGLRSGVLCRTAASSGGVGSSEGNSEGGEGPDRVAGMVTQGGGEVDRSCAAEHADDEVAQAGHVCGPVPVLTWEASSAKVASRRWCRPFTRLALHRWPAGVVLPFDAAPVTFGLGGVPLTVEK